MHLLLLALLAGCSAPPAEDAPVQDEQDPSDDDDSAEEPTPPPTVWQHAIDPTKAAPADDDDSAEELPLLFPPVANICPATAPSTPFADVTDCAGVGLDNPSPDGHDQWWISGQAFADVDGDGRLDAVLTTQEGTSRLFHQQEDGTFITVVDSGVEGAPAGGVTFADWDNDGDPDLYLSVRGADRLLVNEGGLFTSVELPAMGLGIGSAWGDYDADGVLDVYAVNHWCGDCAWQPDEAIEQARDQLLNRGSGQTFLDVSRLLTDWELAGFGFSATWADYDDDGDQDLMVVNDKGTAGPPDEGWTMNRNLYWRNDGPGCDGHCFTEVGQEIGADLRLDSMCLATADYDNDGDLDVFVTDTHQPALLQNFGGFFVDVTLSAGITQNFEGWGCVFVDYDNDGDLDLFSAAGFTDEEMLWRNDGSGGFELVEDTGASDTAHTLGVAAADYDFDGAVDLLLGHFDGSYRLLRNLAPDPAASWLGLRLVGDGPGGRDAVGARVYVEDTLGRTQMREVKIGSSLGAGNDLGLHFGLGEAVPVLVTVRWLDGSEQTITPPLNAWSQVVRTIP